MGTAEVLAAGRLAGDVLAGGVGIVHEVHRAIASRSFAAIGPVGRPIQSLHDAIAGAVYRAVRIAHAAVPHVGAAMAAAALPAGAPSLSDTRHGDIALAAMNGLWGDRISHRHPALALPMSVRAGGPTQAHDVPLTPQDLHASYPTASSRIALFVHGLCETDRWWWMSSRKHYGDADTSHGSRLHRELGYTPVYLRYNTGHRVSANGQRLAALLCDLVEHWPTDVEEIVMVGHSMGGLVVRSACHYGHTDGHTWTRAVRHVVCLGSPHLGAPLERGANVAAWLLARVPETRPVARLLNLRSVGVKDLRFGGVVEEDWQSVDPDELLRDRCVDVPFLDHATYHFIGTTVTRNSSNPLGAAVGDLLVPFPSAAGRGRRRRVPFAVEHGRHLGALHHFDLLNHPAVYRQQHAWLRASATARPAGARRD
jgi:hypothetical protein